MHDTNMNNEKIIIDDTLVRRLVKTQFPQWRDLTVRPVTIGGNDNKIFHLGDQMLVRMPSASCYAVKVEKEHYLLPRLAPLLPLTIPVPLALGEPAYGYPWRWYIYSWLEGETVASSDISDLREIATGIAQFIIALHRIDPTDGSKPGPHNFYRGGVLMTYDEEIRKAITILKGKIDVKVVSEVWDEALATTWNSSPVWVHGDVSAGNLLVQNGRLSSVIDFGGLAVGDPACDLSIAWTLLEGESREIFRTMLPLDKGTWARGRAWTLWKALIIAAGITDTNAVEAAQPWRIIDEVLSDHMKKT